MVTRAVRGLRDGMQHARRVAAPVWARLTAIDSPRDRWRDLLLLTIVVLPMAFNAYWLWPEVSRPIPSVNDDAFHYLMIRSASDAIERGENPLDPWGPEMDLGAPRFQFYQNLPALFVIALDRVTFGRLGLLDLFNLTRYLLIIALPLTVYWTMRRMEFSRVAAAGGAAASSLLSDAGRYGIDQYSFLWRGWGLYTQQWAIHLSFITLGCLWRLARTGRGAVSTILVASALVLSHLLYAEMMVVTGAFVFLFGVRRADIARRAVQFGAAGLLVAVVTSYLWLTYLQVAPYGGESPYDARWKWDSYGPEAILGWLASGDLFDHERFPVFTLVGALGVASVLIVHGRQRVLAAALFAVWLVLYFGRSVWGPVVDHLPAGNLLLMHRFIGWVHIAGILLIGMGVEAAWRLCRLLPRPAALAAAAAGCALFLIPALLERQAFYALNTRWMGETHAAYLADTEAQTMFATLRALPPGRIYAGLRSNWGERQRIDQIPIYRVLIFEGFSVLSAPLPTINHHSDLMFHFDEQNAAAYDLFDVRYVLAPAGLEAPTFLTPLSKTRQYTLYRAPTSGAAVFASSILRRSAQSKNDLFFANRTWLLSPEPAARSFIRWDYPATPDAVAALPVPGCVQGGTIRDEVLGPDRVSVTTDCAAASTLVIKNTYHPDWRVTVDGRERQTYMVSPSYIGVDVPAGTHRVHAEYRSSPLRTALFAAGLAILAIVLIGRRFVPALRWVLG